MSRGICTEKGFKLNPTALAHMIISGRDVLTRTRVAAKVVEGVADNNSERSPTRIIILDGKNIGWLYPLRDLHRKIYCLSDEIIPINPWKVPLGINSVEWMKYITDAFCRAYGVSKEDQSILFGAVRTVYEKAGIADGVSFKHIHECLNDDPIARERHMLMQTVAYYTDPTRIEGALYGDDKSEGVETVLSYSGITVFEPGCLSTSCRRFLYGVISSALFLMNRHISPNKWQETLLVLGDAEEIFDCYMHDYGDKKVIRPFTLYDKIYRIGSSTGLYVMALCSELERIPEDALECSGVHILLGESKDDDDMCECMTKSRRYATPHSITYTKVKAITIG